MALTNDPDPDPDVADVLVEDGIILVYDTESEDAWLEGDAVPIEP